MEYQARRAQQATKGKGATSLGDASTFFNIKRTHILLVRQGPHPCFKSLLPTRQLAQSLCTLEAYHLVSVGAAGAIYGGEKTELG